MDSSPLSWKLVALLDWNQHQTTLWSVRVYGWSSVRWHYLLQLTGADFGIMLQFSLLKNILNFLPTSYCYFCLAGWVPINTIICMSLVWRRAWDMRAWRLLKQPIEDEFLTCRKPPPPMKSHTVHHVILSATKVVACGSIWFNCNNCSSLQASVFCDRIDTLIVFLNFRIFQKSKPR